MSVARESLRGFASRPRSRRWLLRISALACFAIAAAVRAPSSEAVQFVDVAAESGLDFVHANAATDAKFLIETMGGGAAWLDFDGDGFLDIYLLNSAATEEFDPDGLLTSVLYRSRGDGTFEDVTAASGAAASGLFGMGVATGDFDNDGDPDMAVTGFGRSVLYRNEGDGTFRDVTQSAGTTNSGMWGSSAAWFDFDNDGWLDLAIVNYLDWTPATNAYCGERRPGYRSYCHPNKYGGQIPTLYRNLGNGTFEDVTESAGLGSQVGNSLGIVSFDYDRDGWMDVFIANDSMRNFLYRNLGDGTFQDTAFLAGVALGQDGEAEAGMGTDAADYDGDGWPDLYMTHLDFEFDRLYRNRGDGTFADATFEDGIGYATFKLSGFGVRFVDMDNDGWRDLFVANGHVLDNIALFHEGTKYAEPKLLFRNVGGKFREESARSGEALAAPRVSRAAAFGDYDNDGDVDVLIGNNGQAPELLRNEGGNRNNWLHVRLIGVESNRDGVGASVTVRAGDATLDAQRTGGGSYQAAHDPRLHFGLGEAERVDKVEVAWPSGRTTEIESVDPNQTLVVREGAERDRLDLAPADR